MSGYLLDTHTILNSVGDPLRVSRVVRAAIERGPAFISTASYWEVTIKSMKGTLDIGDPRIWWAESLDAMSAKILHILPAHVARLRELPPIHADPFDRILIAQAIDEGLTFLTTDAAILRYAPNRFAVLS